MKPTRVHGDYELVEHVVFDGYAIRRRQNGRTFGVAEVETFEQWDRFVAALESGADEVAAVFAIDAESKTEGWAGL